VIDDDEQQNMGNPGMGMQQQPVVVQQPVMQPDEA